MNVKRNFWLVLQAIILISSPTVLFGETGTLSHGKGNGNGDKHRAFAPPSHKFNKDWDFLEKALKDAQLKYDITQTLEDGKAGKPNASIQPGEGKKVSGFILADKELYEKLADCTLADSETDSAAQFAKVMDDLVKRMADGLREKMPRADEKAPRQSISETEVAIGILLKKTYIEALEAKASGSKSSQTETLGQEYFDTAKQFFKALFGTEFNEAKAKEAYKNAKNNRSSPLHAIIEAGESAASGLTEDTAKCVVKSDDGADERPPQRPEQPGEPEKSDKREDETGKSDPNKGKGEDKNLEPKKNLTPVPPTGGNNKKQQPPRPQPQPQPQPKPITPTPPTSPIDLSKLIDPLKKAIDDIKDALDDDDDEPKDKHKKPEPMPPPSPKGDSGGSGSGGSPPSSGGGAPPPPSDEDKPKDDIPPPPMPEEKKDKEQSQMPPPSSGGQQPEINSKDKEKKDLFGTKPKEEKMPSLEEYRLKALEEYKATLQNGNQKTNTNNAFKLMNRGRSGRGAKGARRAVPSRLNGAAAISGEQGRFSKNPAQRGSLPSRLGGGGR